MRLSIRCFEDIFYFGVMLILLLANPVWAAEPNSSSATDLLKGVEVLDLQTAAKIALAGNPSLVAAQARVEQAAQVVRQAQAPYWPQVDASTGYSRVELSQRDYQPQSLLASASGTTLRNPEDYYQLGLKASYLIFDGFAREFQLAATRHGQQASVESREDARRLLLSAVTGAYLQTQLSQENVAITRADEAFNQRQLTEARLRYDVGSGALSDVLNFEVRVNSAKSQRIQEERSYKAGLIGLAALLGVPQGHLPDQVRPAELSPTTNEELAVPQSAQLVDSALALRPDLKQLDWTVKQAEAGVKIAEAGYYPTVGLSGAYNGQRTENYAFEGDDFGNTIGIGLTWNLFAGGLTRARTGEAKARIYELENTRADVKNQISAEVNRLVTLINASQEQLVLQESNTQLVTQQRDLVEKEYKAGVGSLVRLNEAQRDLTVSLAQLALSRVALRSSWYQLQTATGQILETFK